MGKKPKRRPPRPQYQTNTEVCIQDNIAELLDNLDRGSNVAVVTLLGSLCPITVGHLQAFVEARRLLLNVDSEHHPEGLETFHLVIGFISLNPDSYVDRKFQRNGVQGSPLDFNQRSELVRLAIQDMDWMGMEEWEGDSVPTVGRCWPHHKFMHFTMNGADDVVRSRKWRWAGPNDRYITMGRPGITETLIEKTLQTNVNPTHFIVGPELSNVSSTEAREALERGDEVALDGLLDPRVKTWCLENGPWARESQGNNNDCTKGSSGEQEEGEKLRSY